MPRGYPNQPKAQAAPTHPSDPSDPSDCYDCYDCRTIDQRLAELADKLSRVDGRMLARLAALEAVVSPAIANREWMDEIEKRLAAVEAAAADHRLAEDRWQARQDDQLAELTDRLAALEERLTEIDELATEAREEKATADDTLLTVDIMAVYEMMARREILEATHATPTNPS